MVNGVVGLIFVVPTVDVVVDVSAYAVACLGADNPVIRIVKAVVLVANRLLSKVPLVLICVPKGMFGSDLVKVGSPLLLLLISCSCECCCKCGCKGGWFGCCRSDGQ